MAKGQYLNRAQQGIVKRYYEHQGSVQIDKLQELVGDLALAPSDAAREKLWKKAVEWLEKAKVAPEKIAKLSASKSIEQFAAIVGQLSKP